MKYKLLHAHGNAGPKGKRSYLQFGTYSTRKAAIKSAKLYRLDSKRIVPISKVSKTSFRKLYYIKK